MKSFEELGLSEDTLRVLKRKGYEEPTPIQARTIPVILAGIKDVVGQAQTGTGKTAAFGLPMIELLRENSGSVQALVLTPTRELAVQVAEEINSLKGKKKMTIVPIYGGQSIEMQLKTLKKGVDIVVGTPGRIIDHLKRRALNLENISHLVLDEADEMLNMGFIDEVREILEKTAAGKRTMLFSATMPKEIMRIAEKYMSAYELIGVQKGDLTVSQTDQIYFEVSEADKFEALSRIIDIEDAFYGLIFCRTKLDVDAVANRLIDRGYDADALHGDLSQGQREKILGKFKKRKVNILVATDVAARGIDVQDLTHVINYALPQDPESYVHRIGRTGRAGKEGTAITFITPGEYRKLQYIRKEAKTDIRKAKLPNVKDVIDTKKQRIKAEFAEIIRSRPAETYLEMARELLEENDAVETLAAILQHSFHEELDAKSYTEIEDATVDFKGRSRLFVAKGKKDGLSPKKLADFIKDKCGIREDKIRQIQILEKFSFVTLPFHEAEMVLEHFRKTKKGRWPLITKAKEGRKS
ncbi:MAG: DEAD/DEAH box helicase [Nitrospirae bacterium]|nr:DEAD/DEAH box helicase [Nitrospirota bacterium]